MNKAVQRNLRLLQAIRCMTAAFVLFPVYVLFYQLKGLSLTQIFLLEAIYGGAAALLEVPSGWFADRFGHRRSILIACIMIAAGFGLYNVSQGFFSLLIAELCIGIGYGFRSGADSALAYESLKAIGEEERYRKFEVQAQTYGSIGGIVGAVGGGFIAAWSLELVVVTQTLVALSSIPLAWLLQESPRSIECHEKPRQSLKEMGGVIKYALYSHSQLKWLIWATGLISSTLSLGYWLAQPYYKAAAIPVEWFGVLGGCYLGAVALFTLLFNRFPLATPRTLLTIGVAMPTVIFAVMGVKVSVLLVPVLLGFCFMTAVTYPIVLEQINHKITDSTIRATVLSVRALVARLLMIASGPIIGWIHDAYSLQTALLSSAAICVIFAVVLIVGLAKTFKETTI